MPNVFLGTTMGRAKGTQADGPGNFDSGRSGRYAEEHEANRVLSEVQGQREARAGEAGPPGFPSLADLKAVNRAIHDDAGQSERYALDQPSPLRSGLKRGI